MIEDGVISERSRDDLLSEITSLRQQITEIEQEKEDLETLLEMTTEHSDIVEEELHGRAEEAIQQSERRLRMIIEATPVAVVITEIVTSTIVFANTIAGPLVGNTAAELIGQKVTNFYADPSERTYLVELLKKNFQIDHYEVELVRKNASRFWADISMRYLEFNGKPSILAAWNDISHLKELNKAASRFVPREYLSFLEKESLINIQLGDHVTDEMTVMFSDLRSFTTISEGMTPQQNFDFINAY
ncbi:MAG: PAS domain S-box protein, partial [Methyloprofundus sp.]|nr:PAS domain S-box protein [Methyloprofundus sp.]